MFRRRVELHPIQKIREIFWPRSGWKRTLQYGWRRVWRLSGTPHAIALGVAAGAFSSCTPFLGFHILLAMLVAWVLRGNLIASAIGTFVGNPLTFPAIWFVVYEAGHFIIGSPTPADPDIAETLQSERAFDMILPLLVPLTVGSIPVGIMLGGVSYIVVRSGVEAYQGQRRKMLTERVLLRQAVSREPGVSSESDSAANDPWLNGGDTR
ncbi:conserved hypothetical protein [Parvibaculum lavamentivorans DS-1]|uniref:DUF2062 domain-containing protein n=1 Tax=Parvibaculum lavamentivorans (strain DS-1 / DSM 13023 / NCIMB 13966) TaxID=402881 RepID=A7HX44_PARL1|nr:DUF2062 domain-containing protein [Parvibaculum lavamentivorans]ABS64477.1 conserved hypothetical protein [Parvibaculum lavamentivorans DS-1]